MSDAIRLSDVEIWEVSGVSDPANELPGWLVCKSRNGVSSDIPLTPASLTAISEIEAFVRKTKTTPALAAPPPLVAERGDLSFEDALTWAAESDPGTLQIHHENGVTALTTDVCKAVRIVSKRGTVEVLKSDLEAAETAAIDPGLSFAPEAEVVQRRADVIEKARVYNRDERTGQFAGRWFQRAQSRPKLAGTTFFK